jgi:hypothetical protein
MASDARKSEITLPKVRIQVVPLQTQQGGSHASLGTTASAKGSWVDARQSQSFVADPAPPAAVTPAALFWTLVATFIFPVSFCTLLYVLFPLGAPSPRYQPNLPQDLLYFVLQLPLANVPMGKPNSPLAFRCC